MDASRSPTNMSNAFMDILASQGLETSSSLNKPQSLMSMAPLYVTCKGFSVALIRQITACCILICPRY